MPESQFTGVAPKRKKPPTFQHLPLHRAKTLKKQWVEKTKIKSKWKAEKRKEDLASSSRLDIPVYQDDESHEHNVAEGSGRETDGAEAGPRTMKKPMVQAPHMHPSRAHIHPTLPVRQAISMEHKPNGSKPMKKRKRSETEPAEPVSLRDLTREAYSSSTLHTFKTDPLKRNRSKSDQGGRGIRGTHRDSRAPETGRGQPNMKLRMNAMLAKIKQDFA